MGLFFLRKRDMGRSTTGRPTAGGVSWEPSGTRPVPLLFLFSFLMTIYRGEMPRSYSEQAIELMHRLNSSQLQALVYLLGLDGYDLFDGSRSPIDIIEAIPRLCEQDGIPWNDLFESIHRLLEPPRGQAHDAIAQRQDAASARVWDHAPVPRPTAPISPGGASGYPTYGRPQRPAQEDRLEINVLNELERRDAETVERLMDIFLGKKGAYQNRRVHLDGVAPLTSFIRLVSQRPGDLERLWDMLKAR